MPLYVTTTVSISAIYLLKSILLKYNRLSVQLPSPKEDINA